MIGRLVAKRLHGLDRPGEGRVEVVEHEPDAVAQVRVRGDGEGGGGVRDEARGRLAEAAVVEHGEAQDAPEVGLVEGALGGEGGEGDGAVQRDFLSDGEGVDGV